MVAPGIVIAATASGTGKTTISTGLMRALSRRHAVAPFKVGPDYIDPGYHGVAAGRPGRNLDSFMCATEMIGPLYAHGAADSDIAVSYTHLTLPTKSDECRSRWSPYH